MYPLETSSQHRLPPVLLCDPQDGQSSPILVVKRGLWFRTPGFTPEGCVIIGNPSCFSFLIDKMGTNIIISHYYHERCSVT